jgi:serine protease Do
LPAGAVARLGVIRDGARQSVDVVLSKYPVRGRKVVTVRPQAWRGLRVDYASALYEPDQPQHFGLPLTDEAVAVSEVEKNTPAERAGIRHGMLISQVDGRPVRTPKDFASAVADKRGKVELRLVAGNPSNSVLVIPPGS